MLLLNVKRNENVNSAPVQLSISIEFLKRKMKRKKKHSREGVKNGSRHKDKRTVIGFYYLPFFY
jgi:hypothetical protein